MSEGSGREPVGNAPRARGLSPQRDAPPSALLPLAVAVIAVLVGLVILLFEPVAHAVGTVAGADWSRGFNTDERGFLERGPTALWLFLLCAQTTLWALLLFPLVGILRELAPWRRPTTELLGLGALALLVAASVIVARQADYPRPLPHQATKVAILTTFAVVVAYVGAVGIWRVHAAVERALTLQLASLDARDWLRRLRELGRADGAPEDPVGRYVYLRDLLDRVLGFMAIIVGVGSSAVVGRASQSSDLLEAGNRRRRRQDRRERDLSS